MWVSVLSARISRCAAMGLVAGSCACGAGLPRPTPAEPDPADFVVAPKPPPVTRVEVVPPRPGYSAVWVDGHFEWAGRHWLWRSGGWFEPPEGATYSAWAIRYRRDGQVLFWPPRWRSAEGEIIERPRARRARRSAGVRRSAAESEARSGAAWSPLARGAIPSAEAARRGTSGEGRR